MKPLFPSLTFNMFGQPSVLVTTGYRVLGLPPGKRIRKLEEPLQAGDWIAGVQDGRLEFSPDLPGLEHGAPLVGRRVREVVSSCPHFAHCVDTVILTDA